MHLHKRVSVYESNFVNFTGPIFKYCPFHKFNFFPEVKEKCYKHFFDVYYSRNWFYKGSGNIADQSVLSRTVKYDLSWFW